MSGNKLSQLRDEMKGAKPQRQKSVLQQALESYWNRQGRMASQGLQMADEGAQAVRGGDFSGLGGALLGPVAYLSSPINALFPERSEVDAATDVPSWSKPLIAGGLETMAIMAPGPKGPKGLGRGMASLADDATDAERAALAGRLEAEATQTGTGAVPVSRDQALTNLVQGEPEGILAYHGSPHTFDKFDMSKIGTGEGAQAYGHGLYFAENEGVAKSYRDALAKPSWQVPPEKIAPELADLGFDPKALELARDTLRNLNGDGYQAVSALDGAASNTGSKVAKEAASAIRSFNRNATRESGSMYQVRLNVKPDELLDWDRPLSEQSKLVQGVSRKAGSEFDKAAAEYSSAYSAYQSRPENASPEQVAALEAAVNDTYGRMVTLRGNENLTGAGLYREMAGGQPWNVPVEKLKAAGIKGIRYKDAGSRGAEGGTYNYVIFDDKLVDILKRYGVAMTAGAGGAVIVSGQDMPPEVAAQIGPQA